MLSVYTILNLLSSLDIGADGLVLPHIKTPEQAKAIIKNCFYGNNGRGYAGSSRFAGYTTHALTDNLASNKSSTCIIAQIEDADALDNIEQLCQIDEIDCIFIAILQPLILPTIMPPPPIFFGTNCHILKPFFSKFFHPKQKKYVTRTSVSLKFCQKRTCIKCGLFLISLPGEKITFF